MSYRLKIYHKIYLEGHPELGLDRIPKELNSDYKDRLFDVYENPADSTEQGMINGVVRELGIKKLVEDYDDSDATSILASGYGVRINVLNDETYTDDQLNSNNNALGTYLEEAVTKLDDIGSILWNKATFDLSFTDVISEEYTGLAYLPNLYDADASGFTLIQYSNGVGDLNDLKIVEADGIDPSYVQVAGYSTEDLPFRLNGLSDDNESRIDDIYWLISEDMYDNYYDVAGNPAGGTLAGLSEAFNIFLYDSEGNYIT